MRIWFIAENWPPRIGGIERYLTGLATHLAQRGHTITIFAPHGSQHIEGVTVITPRFFWPIIKPSWFPFFLFLLKTALAQKPDAIICGKALFEGRVAQLLKNTLHIPYVVCTYGMEIATWQEQPATRAQLVTVLRSANHTLVINEKTKWDVVNLGATPEHISTLYPGITPEMLTQTHNPEEVMQRLGITTPFVMTVARLIPRKGVDDLLNALAKITPHMSLVVVGDGPEKDALEQLTKKLGIAAHFTGKLTDKDIHALYTQATLFALTPKELPGDYEGFGIVYLEAAFFGLPTLGTRTGGVPEAIQEHMTGLIAEPGNVQSIASALQTLLDNPATATHYGKIGKERVLRDFQWSTSIDTLERILHSL